jgi:hypothetical protein
MVICAWCGMIQKEGTLTASHTICPRCLCREKARLGCSGSTHIALEQDSPSIEADGGEDTPAAPASNKQFK